MRPHLAKRYYVDKDAYFCVYGSRFVFLQLRTDQYTLVNGSEADFLFDLLNRNGMHGSENREETEETTDFSDDQLSGFFSRRLLTTKSGEGKILTPTLLDPATKMLIEEEYALSPDITFSHIANFTWACLVAEALLKFHIRKTVHAVRRLRPTGNRTKDQSEFSEAKDVVRIFKKLRMWHPRNFLCRFDSLLLLQFLARYEIYPHWVYGVQLEPWSAHCWVQHNGILFDDELERVSEYKPIMVI